MKYPTSLLRKLAIGISILTSLMVTSGLFGETDFTLPPGRAASPVSITVGPDHNLWFTEQAGQKIGKITTTGVITEFPISGAQALTGIASGPDGNIWFTDEFAGTIGRISTSGTGLRTFSLPANSHPQGITAGPDGNLWYVNEVESGNLIRGGFKIGKITVSGRITEYSTRINAGPFDPEDYAPSQIVKGPDGNLWFTNPQLGRQLTYIVGKITTSGIVKIYNTGDVPIAITSGPDGNLWVTENANVAKISTSGKETEYALTSGSGGWSGITVGPDGNIWFDELTTIGYVTPEGVVNEFPQQNYSTINYLSGIVTGPDGALWTVGSLTSNIGRVVTTGQLANTYALSLGSLPSWNTLGPDGAVWFTASATGTVGRIDTNGVITTCPLTKGSAPFLIVTGPDGNLWFTEQGTNNVAKMTASCAITEYSVGQKFAGLWGITPGPDGNLWFTEYNPRYNAIVRITPDGVMTSFPIPTQDAFAFYITKGPDGNLWFTEENAQQVAEINPSTGQITEYSYSGNYLIGPAAIVTGPDNNLWVMETPGTMCTKYGCAINYGAIAKFSTAGTLLAEYPAHFTTFLDIKVGSDGALWFPQFYPNGVGRITTSGVVSTVQLTAPYPLSNDLAFGADGKIWVAEENAGALGRMSAIGGNGDTIQATHGSPFSGAVASFVDGTPTATSADFTATIAWGDGGKSSGTIAGPTGGPFTVSGTHTYNGAGSYDFTATLHDNVDNATYQAIPGLAQVN